MTNEGWFRNIAEAGDIRGRAYSPPSYHAMDDVKMTRDGVGVRFINLRVLAVHTAAKLIGWIFPLS
jgi:hypothetical protein